jgi:hypothetical protein
MVIGEVRRLWGEQLRPADPGKVYPRLSLRTRQFLAAVGLPVFDSDMGVAVVHDALNQPVSRNGREYLIVGEMIGLGQWHAIDVETDQVCLIGEPESSDPPEFLNTDVALYVLVLGVFEKDIIEASSTVDEDSDEAYEITDRARALLTAMDPDAMSEGSPWESLLSDMESY